MAQLFIDLDSILYKAGFSAQENVHYVTVKGEDAPRASFNLVKDMKAWLEEHSLTKDGVEVRSETHAFSQDQAILVFERILDSIYSEFPNHKTRMFMGGRADYRYALYPEYKANRVDAGKPIHYDLLYSHALAKGAEVPEGIEADDAVCIAAWECLDSGEDFVISRIDKDLAQIPGRHYNYDTGAIEDIDPYTADFNFYVQLLMGDSSDNIPGLFRVGKVKAAAMLEGCEDERDMYKLCTDKWTEAHGEMGVELMNVSAELLYLLRNKDDKWTPPS